MRAISTVVGLVVLLAAATAAQDAGSASPSLLKASFSKLPIYFIGNRGVYPDEVKFYVQGADKTLFFTKDGITFRLEGKDKGWVVKLEFVGANPDVNPRGEDQQQAVFSYFKGPVKDWKTGLETYAKVVYEDLWPGIDLVYRGTVNRLKYEFLVDPGADPGKIRLRYRGVTSLTTIASGALRVETPGDSFEDAPPEAWQDVAGRRIPVTMRYALGEGDAIGFALGEYDPAKPIVLDPAVLVYCGYVGGNRTDSGYDVAVDAAGSAYVTGWVVSTEPTFPATVGPDLTYNGGSWDAFVAKVASDGRSLVYCGYIGGNSDDNGYGIAVDAAGNAYVTGQTSSNEKTFPVTAGPDLTYNGGNSDAFVAKVNAKGTALLYCGYIGGSGLDWLTGIAVDAGGNAYVAGKTNSDERTFPVRVGPDLTYNNNEDAFVAKVVSHGRLLAYCGYIGGSLNDYAYGIAVDAAGNAYVTGGTCSTESTFPVAVGPDLTHNGQWDAFVAKVNAAGTALLYCGYIGGNLPEFVSGIIAVDAAGNAYLAGTTDSTEKTFPVTVGPDLTYNGGDADAFVAKVNAKGTALVYCGYIGGRAFDRGLGIAVDAAGNAYVTGDTQSTEATFPVKVGPDRTHNGSSDAFVAKVNTMGTALICCGYIGGSNWDGGYGIALDVRGNIYVTGYTESAEQTFPVTTGPDLTHNSGPDAFVAKISQVFIHASGGSSPGSRIGLALIASESAGLPYLVGTSLGTGPIPIDTRRIDLSPDPLLAVSVGGLWPAVFTAYRGVIDSKGQAQAAINIPIIPALIGVKLHSAFVTLDPSAPSGIRSISNTFSFSITK